MLRFDDLDTSIQTHERRVADINRHGWLRCDSPRGRQSRRLGVVPGTVGARLVPGPSRRHGAGSSGAWVRV